MKFGIYTLVIKSDIFKDIKENVILSRYKSIFTTGWGNGYVFIPENHPFYNDSSLLTNIFIHGGITYTDIFKSSELIKFISNREIYGDITLDNYNIVNNYMIIGFDTNHYMDDINNCPKEYVIKETKRLLEQCIDNDIPGIQKYKSEYQKVQRLNKLKEIINK